jgi:organic radical activating enzyme
MYLSKLPNGKPEIYKALQGEMMTTGKPCIFVRLSGCNCGCNFCDSAYTWYFQDSTNKVHKSALPISRVENQVSMTPEVVAKAIMDLDKGWSKRIVFTGGEPLLQQKEIWEVVKILIAQYGGCEFEIETNGTIEINDELAKAIKYINCSPKLSSSGNPERLRDNEKAIKKLMVLHKDCFPYLNLNFKFVVNTISPYADIEEIKQWQKKYRVESKYIYLMPEGINQMDMCNSTRQLHEICMELGYNLTTRLHILLFGNQRGI